jgi:hypothetical protein
MPLGAHGPLLDAALDGDAVARRLLADRLEEAGEPYGRYLQRVLNGFEDDETRRLFHVHHRRWLGPDLGRILQNPVFVSGFLERTALRGRRAADEASWRRATRSPWLRTLRRLEKGAAPIALYLDVLCAPGCAHLADVQLPGPRVVREALAQRPACRPHTVRCARLPAADELADPLFDALETLVIDEGPVTEDALGTRRAQVRRLCWRQDAGRVFAALGSSTLPEVWAGTTLAYRRILAPDGIRVEVHGYHPSGANDRALAPVVERAVAVHFVASNRRVHAHQQGEAARLRARHPGLRIIGPDG